jgi:hypothetical protein
MMHEIVDSQQVYPLISRKMMILALAQLRLRSAAAITATVTTTTKVVHLI